MEALGEEPDKALWDALTLMQAREEVTPILEGEADDAEAIERYKLMLDAFRDTYAPGYWRMAVTPDRVVAVPRRVRRKYKPGVPLIWTKTPADEIEADPDLPPTFRGRTFPGIVKRLEPTP